MCVLIEELKRLKKSSQDAVDNEKEFTAFKKYMHVHRKVEEDLKETIAIAKESGKKSLILVCGNVGDGKSHLISYLNNHENRYLEGFIIHNDATESRSRTRNEREELAKVLNDFSDENIDNYSETKVIVAINLGVLSNFIDSEEGSNFKRLAKYVEDKKILIETDVNEGDNTDDVFYHVNFGDYHIYRLIDEKVDSPYISSIIDKIFSDTECNEFYGAYRQCSFCDICDCCPVKTNYEMMSNPIIKSGIVNVILETIIKDKIILSTRDLLNFLYDSVVHPYFEPQKFKKLRGENKYTEFIKYSMPSILYDHDDVSSFMSHVKQYDFITQRTEVFDEIVTRFNTTENVKAIFEEYIEDNSCLKYVLNFNTEYISKHREEMMVFFSRLCKIAAKEGKLEIVNDEFKEFISDLYYSVKKEKSKAKNLYGMVKNCIYKWNGSSGDNELNLNTNHEDYIISTPLDIVTDLSSYDSVKEKNEFERFPVYINVTYCSKKDTNNKATVSIDYDLYKMLKKVEDGYRPSAKDNNYFASFVSFINKLSVFSNSNEEITIKHYVSDEIKSYCLKQDEFGTYEFKEV